MSNYSSLYPEPMDYANGLIIIMFLLLVMGNVLLCYTIKIITPSKFGFKGCAVAHITKIQLQRMTSRDGTIEKLFSLQTGLQVQH